MFLEKLPLLGLWIELFSLLLFDFQMLLLLHPFLAQFLSQCFVRFVFLFLLADNPLLLDFFLAHLLALLYANYIKVL